MPQTTSSITLNSIIARYGESYLMGAKRPLLYDQFAVDYTQFMKGLTMEELMRASSVSVPFRSGMNIGTTALSQTTDIIPQSRYDATASVTPTSRGEALQWSQQLTIQAFSEFTSGAYADIGENVMETVESVIIDAALAGTWADSYVTRSSLDAGTSAHNANQTIFRTCDGMFQEMQVPGYTSANGPEWPVVMHPYVAHDIMEETKILAVSEYVKPEIILNWELGKLGRFRFVVSPFAKVFFGAGADNGTDVDTSLNGAVTRLATTITTAADVAANVARGLFWNIGTIETSTTFYPMNERVVPLSASTYTVTCNGKGPNGGLKYDHASGTDVTANDSVYTMLFCGPESLVRVYATDPANGDPDAKSFPGVKGAAVVGPLRQGLAHQWDSLSWKWWGGYGLISQNRIYRREVSVSYEHQTT